MRLNGQAILTSEGIQFKRKEAAFLNALGIGDSGEHDDATVCWGVWLDTRDRSKFYPSEPDDPNDDRAAPDERQFPHLIVSPLHPTRWTSAFRIEAFLDRAAVSNRAARSPSRDLARGPLRATHRLLELLNARLGVKTLRTEGGISGYDLFVLNAICELPRLRTSIERDDALFLDQLRMLRARGGPSMCRDMEELRRARMRAVGLQMIPALASLCAAVELNDSRSRPIGATETPFLNQRILEYGGKPWFVSRDDLSGLMSGSTALPGVASWSSPIIDLHESIEDEKAANHRKNWSERVLDTDDHACDATAFASAELRQTLRRHGVTAMSARALNALAYSRLFSFPEHEPVRLSLTRNWGLKFADGDEAIFDFLNGFIGDTDPMRFGRDQPHRVITAFHLQDGFVRLRFIRGTFASDRMRVVRVQFAVDASKSESGQIPRGALRAAIQALTAPAFGLRVERIVSRPIVNAPDDESGVIKLLVKTAGAGTGAVVDWAQVESTLTIAIRRELGPSLKHLHISSKSWAVQS